MRNNACPSPSRLLQSLTQPTDALWAHAPAPGERRCRSGVALQTDPMRQVLPVAHPNAGQLRDATDTARLEQRTAEVRALVPDHALRIGDETGEDQRVLHRERAAR